MFDSQIIPTFVRYNVLVLTDLGKRKFMDTTKATAVLFDFDGVVAAAGGYVTVGDKVIAHHVYGQNLLQKVLDTVGDNNTGHACDTGQPDI